jgi:peptidoglycan/LPS O-acetylase OafA/YrhL
VKGDAHERYLATRHFSSLDGLRCLSILPVIWHHSTPRPLPGLLGKGPAGVDLFFCISGFLITTLLLRERAQTGGIQLRDFYARRALRILPLYYTLLCAYSVFAWFLPAGAAPRAHFFRALPLYASFTANWFADFGVAYPILFSFAWSLCIEEQFYAFWPWLVRRLTSSGALAAMTAILVCDALAERGQFSAVLPQGGLALKIVTSFAAPIGLGALLALLLDNARSFFWLRLALGRSWSAPLAFAGVCALLIWPSAPLLAYQLGLAALVGACVIQERHGLSFALEARAPSYVGRVSYGLYLLNLTAIGTVRRLFPSHAGSAGFVFLASFPLALGLAALSSRYLERPFLRLSSRFRRTQPPPRGLLRYTVRAAGSPSENQASQR